jgi:hypothetical protein
VALFDRNSWHHHSEIARLEQTDYEDGSDLADVYIDEVKNIELEQIKDLRNYTATEIMVNRIAEHKPEIRQLIETFDLTDANGNEIRLIN